MELSRDERKDLMRKYGIPTTGFFWRLKKANDMEDLIDLLEKYKQMAIKREKRKLEKELNILKSNANPNREKIEVPEKLLSRDEYQMFIYKHIERAVRAIMPRYPTTKMDILNSPQDIVQAVAYQTLRSSQDRDLTEYSDYLVSYETGERILYAVRRNGKIHKDRNGITVENIKHYVKEPTIEERYKKIDMMFDGWYTETEKEVVYSDKKDKEGNPIPYKVPGIDLYTKYIRGMVKIENTDSFINQVVNNYFKDNIAKRANAPYISSIDVPIGNSNSENTLTLADVYPDYDRDDLSIKEAIEHCEGVIYQGIDLGDIIKEIIYSHTTLPKICKRLGLQTKAVMQQFDKLKIREILGFE